MRSATPVHVAIIDDDESLCRALGRLLRAAGIQTVSYASAEAFFSDVQRPQFACLIIDMHLFGTSGLELKQRLATSEANIPLIFNTACDEPETREKALHAGCAAYLHKAEPGESMLAAVFEAIRSASGNGPNERPDTEAAGF